MADEGQTKEIEAKLDAYVKNTARIRGLSAPTLEDIENAAQYSAHLRDNFMRIGDIAQENRAILDAYFFPYIGGEEALSEDAVETFGEFGDNLLDAYNLDNIDPAILSVLSKELLSRADRIKSDKLLITQLDREIMACYTMVNITGRLLGCADIADAYRARGFAAGEKLLAFLEPEAFKALPDDDTRSLVLINARYLWVLYEGADLSEEEARKNYDRLAWALSLAENPAYRDTFPDYNWKNHVFRTLNYMALTIENHNLRHMPADVREKVFFHVDEMNRLFHSDPYYAELTEEKEMAMLHLRARYESGRLEKAAYIREMFSLYEKRDVTDYDLSGMILNLNIPAEYMLSLDPEHLTEEDVMRLSHLYHDVINYAFHMPNGGSLSYMLEYISAVFRNFIEVPGEITFEDMCLNCLAALHPPTYVHSVMVGQITRCLAGHLYRLHPDVFAEMPEGKNREALLSFAYHAAICHDAGKIMMIDTIFVYGRRLLDEEFHLIKRHPEVGARLLSRHESTKAYANVARGHHLWYDHSAGYPSDFDPSGLPEKPVIDLVTCADCLDAATDTVGRSYNRGKTVDDFLEELRAGSGTRYAPFLTELFEDEAVRQDVEFLLAHGRESNYRKTYLLLRDLKEKGGDRLVV